MRTLLLLIPTLFAPLTRAATEPPSLPETLWVREWLVCGPFGIGVREGITEAVEDPAVLAPQEGDSLRSALVQGGVVRWRRVNADSLGWLETEYPDVRWDSLADYYGVAGIAALGYAYAELTLPCRYRALAVATKVGGFIINGRGYLGDVYGNGWFKTPVVLDSGKNRIILRVSGYGDQRVRFILTPAPQPVLPIVADITAPDLIADSVLESYIGIPLLNTTENPLDSVGVEVLLDTVRVGATVVRNIPGLGVKKVALRLRVPALPFDTSGYQFRVTVRHGEYQLTDTFRLRCRRITQAHRCTFLSGIDSSCQYYAVLYPENYQPNRRYALILALHGAGVEAAGLAECFKPRDWAFVVCPTNRRPYGFDWQDWGRLDALEVLNEVLRRFPIDPDRVVLTGHSMGGHGTWHIGLVHPDLFAGIAPEAGWPSLSLYVPTFLQRSNIFAEPAQLAIRDMALRPDNVPALLENALNLPVFILHGGDDDNVPTLHGRNFALWLEALGYRYVYKEVPGKGHWFAYEDGTPCVDDPDLMRFLRECRRPAGPRHIRFRTADLGQSNSAYWVRLDRVRTVGRDARVEGFATDTLVRLRTENLSQLTLFLDERLFFSGKVDIEIDGQRVLKRVALPRTLIFHREKEHWYPGPAKTGKLQKTPERYGPAKQVLMRPFALIYGTRDPELAGLLRHSANQEALRWYLIANGTTEVLPDTAPPPLERNLMIYGGPAENALSAKVARFLPITIEDGRVRAGIPEIQGESRAVLLTYPNPLNPEKLLLIRMGTDPPSTKLAFFFGLIGSGTGLPDFLVFDPRVRRFGWAGVCAAGFFSPDWQFDPASTYIGGR